MKITTTSLSHFGLVGGMFDELGIADIIDTYVYRVGLAQFEYSFSSAVGLFKSVVGLVMVLVVNTLARRIGDQGSALW